MFTHDWERVKKRCGFMVPVSHLAQVVNIGRYEREEAAPKTWSTHAERNAYIGVKVKVSPADIPAIERAFGIGREGGKGSQGRLAWVCGYCGSLGSALLCSPDIHRDIHDNDEMTIGRDEFALLEPMTLEERTRRDRIVKTNRGDRGDSADINR